MSDTATYKPLQCYQCGETMHAYWMNDVWDMRIDGHLHRVPVKHVPCYRCVPCDLTVTDGASDEAVQWNYVEYCKQHGLYTPWHRLRRWLSRRWSRVCARYQRWLVR